MATADYTEELLLTLRTVILRDVVPEFPFITTADVHVEDPDPRYVERLEAGDTSAAIAIEIAGDQPSPRFVAGEVCVRAADATANVDLVVRDKRLFDVDVRVYARRRRWKRLLARRLERYFEDNPVVPCFAGDATTGNELWIVSVTGKNLAPEDDMFAYQVSLSVETQELEEVRAPRPTEGVEITLQDYDEGG